MINYEIIYNNEIIDVIKNAIFIRFLSDGSFKKTAKFSAQGILDLDSQNIYRLKPGNDDLYKIVTIKEISLKESNRLQSLLDSNQKIIKESFEVTQTKQVVIKQLSNICREKIIAGFDVKLSDGVGHNFKLTTEDQLNLFALENQLHSGSKTFLYHATNEPCKFFSKSDMTKIINAARNHIRYHTTYFNLAKQYINSLTDLQEINSFTYGTDISRYLDDNTLKFILKSR